MDKYELVIFQKVYEAEDLKLAEKIKKSNKKVVFDLCDNHFAYPNTTPDYIERINCLKAMIDIADAISVSTAELAKLIQHPFVHIIDDAIDIPPTSFKTQSLFRLKRALSGKTRALNLVWFGNAGLQNPPFGLIDLSMVIPHLEALNKQHLISLSIISSSKELADKYVGKPSFPVSYYPWDRSTFSSIFRLHDICIIPVNLNSFTLCKTNNRLVLSLLLGVPVIADEIPSYSEFKEFVLFSNWEENLLKYASNQDLMRKHVLEGQRYIQAKYCREHTVRQWLNLINAVF